MKDLRKALCFGLLVLALIVLSERVAAPLHAAGTAQAPLAYFMAGIHLLNLPGVTVAQVISPSQATSWNLVAVCARWGVNLAFWGIAALIVLRCRGSVSRPAAELYEDPSWQGSDGGKISRRHLMVGSGRAVAGAGLALGSWGLFAEPRWFEVTRREFAIKGLPAELDRLRIVQLSDLHYGAWMSLGWVRRVIEASNSLAPDLVLLTGDYVYHGPAYVRPVARELTRLRANVGVVGVLGNHDWTDGGGVYIKRVFAEEGIRLIDNGRVFITPSRRMVDEAREGLCVAGVGDLWEDKCLYSRALGCVSGGMPRILLSHNPDVAEEGEFIRSGYRVDLMLSGHTHGGQVRLPLVGSPVTNSAYGQKYAKGLVAGPVCPVFVSRGLGMTVMPIRIGVRPEVALIELRSV